MDVRPVANVCIRTLSLATYGPGHLNAPRNAAMFSRNLLAISEDLQGSGTSCAIYTRKSSEEGLEKSFNSLSAQESPNPATRIPGRA